MRQTYLIATLLIALTLIPGTLHAQSPSQLPVIRVSLYKNGVGFFEHAGRVTGDQSVNIDFTTSQLNDVLQSLTAIDLNGGRIAGAGYNSTTPLEEQLKALPLALGEDPTAIGFYNAIRGARVEVHGPGAKICGRLLNIEVVDAAASGNQPASEKRMITVIGEGGEIRTVELTPTTEVRLLDADLHNDVTRYLQLLASTRGNTQGQGLRHLTLQDNGTGARELRVSYISEVPIWKSTYRILFTEPKTTSDSTPSTPQTATLQGWSVVDNTTGADWINVQLSLIAGAPQSFIQPLSVPIYSRRPMIGLPQEAQLAPQTHESGEIVSQAKSRSRNASGGGIQGTITDRNGGVIIKAQVTATNTDTGVAISRSTTSTGSYSISPLPVGTYNVEVVAPGFQRLLQENVNVDNASMYGLNLKLSVGSKNETITVTDAPPSLDTTDATLGGTIENELYSELPLSMNGGPRNSRARNSTAGASGFYGGTGQVGLNENFVEGVPVNNINAQGNAVSADALNQYAQNSFAGNALTAKFDDYFEYKISEPITIRKNESAMVPILQTKIDAERVTLWSQRQPVPLRALWITNTSKLTLDRGSFSIVEDGNFGGEGLLDPIHPDEKRLLSYAVDQVVRVTLDPQSNSSQITSVSAAKGVVFLRACSRSSE